MKMFVAHMFYGVLDSKNFLKLCYIIHVDICERDTRKSTTRKLDGKYISKGVFKNGFIKRIKFVS